MKKQFCKDVLTSLSASLLLTGVGIDHAHSKETGIDADQESSTRIRSTTRYGKTIFSLSEEENDSPLRDYTFTSSKSSTNSYNSGKSTD